MSATRSGPGDGGALIELDEATCWRLLASRPVGRLAWCQAAGPVLVPVNHTVEDRTVVVRTAPWASMVAQVDDSPVAYQVDDFDQVTREGWSVLVRGTAEVGYDASGGPEPWPAGSHAATVRIRPVEVTGRRVAPR
ncbi:Pyridoxamine 5'-phosphate oxidase [Nocardioides dokdonensis FR1436]|uniref:Pyridoxamine 5'-phosphate oxidase n=1 Tax=Nocardioides dokdonensis FR1436 TaxID=1300347 RepID=A0A1A9GLS9_9ACTN|nr:pyridoxamine 5'-phosphate oxidase family protein [Nocardioides dokdonensis]ANH39228.1 Pyridoxamine 5'-phosphate oxidase [Nocardioides dokdonensis FR1436]